MLDTEKLMPLADAAKIALGFDKHKSTIYRWATKGVRGASGRRVFLNYRRIGGELMCTIQDVHEFDEAIRSRQGFNRVDPLAPMNAEGIAACSRRLSASDTAGSFHKGFRIQNGCQWIQFGSLIIFSCQKRL